MALSLNANFLAAAARGTCEPRFLVELYVEAGTSFKFLSGKCDSFSHPESITKVVPVTRTLDYLKRTANTSTATITFVRDTLWETILDTYAVKGGHVDISLGFAELAEGDFEPHAGLIVENVRETEVEISLVCKTVEKKFGDEDIYWQWIGLHPLQIARRILVLAGIPNARVDLTTLDPATYSADISHFACSRVHGGIGMFGGTRGIASTNAMSSPISAGELLSDVAQILGGSFIDDETGAVAFTKFDPAAAVVDSWTEDDITDLLIEPLYENLINRVTVNTHPYNFTNGDPGHIGYYEEDTASQAAFSVVVPGGSDENNVKEFVINTDWIAGVAQLYSNFTPTLPANGAKFIIQGWATHGFCGTAWGDITHGPPGAPTDFYSTSNYGTGSQNAEHAVSSSRPVYIRVGGEILKCTSMSVIDDAGMWAQNPLNDTNYNVQIPHRLEFTLAASGGRAALGTTAATHSGIDGGGTPDLCFDMTIQERIARVLVERLRHGGHVIQASTGLGKYKVTRGDLIDITLPASRFRAKGRAGLDSATKFEITEKAVDLYADPPRLKWTMVEAAWSGAPAASLMQGGFDRLPAGLALGGLRAAMNADVGDPHIESGLDVASASVFDVTFNPGIASSLHTRAEASEQSTFTVAASKDTYFAADTASGNITSYEVANLAAQPTKAPQEAWMAKVVSDGAGITSADDVTLRTTTAIHGERLHDDTVGVAVLDRGQDFGAALNLNASGAMRTRG